MVAVVAGTVTMVRDDRGPADGVSAAGPAAPSVTTTSAPASTTTEPTTDPAGDPSIGVQTSTPSAVDDFPDGGGPLVYNGEGGIRAIMGNGTDDRLLANGNDPSWSRDRSRVVYSNGTEIRVIDADGSGDRAVANGENVIKPSFSPDGTKIVYYETPEYIVVVDSVTGTELARSSGGGGPPIRWAPDSRSLAYLLPSSAVHVLSVDTGADSTLIEGSISSFDWAADGRVIVGHRNNAKPEIVAINPITGTQAVLATNYDSFVRSPSGRLFAYTVGGAAILEADGTVVRTLVMRNVRLSSGSGTGPLQAAWSPDARLLAVTSRDGRTDRYALEIWSASGENVSTTDAGAVSFDGLIWSPDSTLVAGIEMWTSNDTALWVARTDGISRAIGTYRNGISGPLGLDW